MVKAYIMEKGPKAKAFTEQYINTVKQHFDANKGKIDKANIKYVEDNINSMAKALQSLVQDETVEDMLNNVASQKCLLKDVIISLKTKLTAMEIDAAVKLLLMAAVQSKQTSIRADIIDFILTVPYLYEQSQMENKNS